MFMGLINHDNIPLDRANFRRSSTGEMHGTDYDAVEKERIWIAGLLIPGAIVGSYLGAMLMHISPIRLIRAIFICYLLWAGYSQWTAKSRTIQNTPPADLVALVRPVVSNSPESRAGSGYTQADQ